jgi:TatA/E family protein of Tat protein translocase
VSVRADPYERHIEPTSRSRPEVTVFDSIDDWLIIAVVAGILFYGSSKIPQLAHSLGRSVGEFKKGRIESEREIQADQARAAAGASASAPTPPAH